MWFGPLIALTINKNNDVFFSILGDKLLLFIQYLLDEYGTDTAKHDTSLVHWASYIHDWFNEHSET